MKKGCIPLIIGDDWFSKTMLVNTLSRNENLRSQMATTNSDSGQLFAAVLNQLIEQYNLPSNVKPNTNFYSPALGIGDTAFKNDEPLRFDPISEEKINQVLDGKLKGMGQSFVRAGEQYNIDPALLVAIAQHETGNGKSRAVIEKNNVAGMMGTNGLKKYTTITESIMDMARNLSKNYLELGLSSITKIGEKYAPIGAENDPNNLNNHWVSGVINNFNQLKV